MINSRSLDDLTPEMKIKCQAFIEKCKSVGIDILITSTYRDFESQDALYAQGRTTKGNIVTNAKGGQSYHNYRIAFDFVPVVGGKCDWNNATLFTKCGIIGESLGLTWAGRFKSIKELAHFQMPDVTLKQLQEAHKGK